MIGYSPEDTIVAISTPAGPALVAIVRLSGSLSFPIIDQIFKGPSLPSSLPSYSRTSGEILLSKWDINLPVTLYLMKGPKSYTREDVVECHTFGSSPLLEMLLEEFLQRGARMAQPGEFTRRAFLSGRIDLSQAEGVISMIMASDEKERKLAMEGISGAISKLIEEKLNNIKEITAWVEASIDFAEDDIEIFDTADICGRLQNISEILKKLSSQEEGESLNEKPTVSLVGLPNAGKSSLFNYLLSRPAAIVTPIPGTTRDILEEELTWKWASFRVLDMPGINENPSSALWEKAMNKARERIGQSHIILFLIDSTSLLTGEEEKLLRGLPPLPTLIVYSKADLSPALSIHELEQRFNKEVLPCSTQSGSGVNEILEWIIANIVTSDRTDRMNFVSVRQRNAARSASYALDRAVDALRQGLSTEFAAIELRESIDYLGMIVGKVITDEILDLIFSRFCIGK